MHGFRYPYSEDKYAVHILPDQLEVQRTVAANLLWMHLSCRLTA